MKKQYEILFTPMKIGTLELDNRFILEPMEGTNIIDSMMGIHFKENVHDYYIERAKSGIGLMIPGMMLLRSLIGDQWLYEAKDEFYKAKPLLDEIHEYGSKVFFQLGAGWGRSFMVASEMKPLIEGDVPKGMPVPPINFNHLLVSASETPNVWDPTVSCRALTKEEIQEYVDAYAKVAKLCKEIGVDGVEVHAVHEGYLLDQFTTKYTNNRTDEYGGSFENRYRFAVEVVQAIKEACGEDYPVSLRYSVTSKTKDFNSAAVPGEEYIEAGRDLEEGLKAAKYLQDAGYDMLNADNGTYDAWFWAHPPVYMPLNCNMREVCELKKVVDIPVICAGRMQLDDAAEAILNGQLNGVGIARQFLTDPEYLLKIKEDRLEDIIPCIACHNACLPLGHMKGRGAVVNPEDAETQGHCAINPRTFKEKEYTIVPAEKPKRIAIIGGGIGGMTVAMIAKKRGHDVTLYEKSDELGGVFIAAAAPSFKEKDKELILWYKRQMEQLNIDIRFNTEVTNLKELDADEIVVAIGSKPRVLPVEGSDQMIEAIEYLRGKKEVGKTVAVIGGGLTGCEIAYDLALKGKKPIIVEMTDDILKVNGLCMANSSCLRELLRYHQVEIYTDTCLEKVDGDRIWVKSSDETKTLQVDSVIASCGYIPAEAIYGTDDMDNVHLIGDCGKIGNLKSVIWGAYDLAFQL